MLTAKRSPRPLLGRFSYHTSASGLNCAVVSDGLQAITNSETQHTKLMMKNFGAILSLRASIGARVVLRDAAAATWPRAKSLDAVERHRIVRAKGEARPALRASMHLC